MRRGGFSKWLARREATLVYPVSVGASLEFEFFTCPGTVRVYGREARSNIVRAGEAGHSNGGSGGSKNSDVKGVAATIDAISDRGIYGGIERSDISGRG